MAFGDGGRRNPWMERIKMGAMMGAGVGGAAGLLFGTFEAARYRGIPPSQKIGLVIRNSVGGAFAFGFFLAIGTGIRSLNAEAPREKSQ